MKRSPVLAAIFSLIPGMGQVYIGQARKGFSLLCVAAAVALTFFFSQSPLVRLIAAVTYLFAMVPAAVEAFLITKTGKSPVDLDSRRFTVFMLLMTGGAALPLLWQSRCFTRRGKVLWTGLVIALAALYFGGLIFFWKDLNELLKGTLSSFSPG